MKYRRGMPDKGKHHFTFAYSPWANGSVERVNRTILDLFKILRSESHLAVDEWPYLLDHVRSVLNRTPSNSLNGFTPLELFTGMSGFGPFNVLFYEEEDRIQGIPLLTEQVRTTFEKLKEHLYEMHRNVNSWRNQKQAKKEKRARDAIYSAENRFGVDFSVGDFVMLAVPNKKNHHKLVAKWRGPYRVTRAVSDYIYEVENLNGLGLKIESHIKRLKFFCDSDLDNECVVAMANEVSLQDSVDNMMLVESIEEYSLMGGEHLVRIKWLSLSTLEGTWESLTEFNETCPELVEEFIQRADDLTQAKMRRGLAQ